jgi:hypothetical protein
MVDNIRDVTFHIFNSPDFGNQPSLSYTFECNCSYRIYDSRSLLDPLLSQGRINETCPQCQRKYERPYKITAVFSGESKLVRDKLVQ